MTTDRILQWRDKVWAMRANHEAITKLDHNRKHCRCRAYSYEHIAGYGYECRKVRERDGFVVVKAA